MIKFAFRDEGLIDLADEVVEETRIIAVSRMDRASKILQAHVQRNLSTNTGPEPSKPGEFPTKQSGRLYDSIKTIATRVFGNIVRGGIRTNHPGAARMEWGSTSSDGKVVAARSYIRPAEETAGDEITRELEGGL